MSGAGAGDALERVAEPTPAKSAKPKRVVLATVPSDSHMWNLVFMELLLKEQGIEVTNLGACTPIELVVETCLAERPDLLVISSVNGHGHLGGRRIIKAIREQPELADMPAVIGGKLGTLGVCNSTFAEPLVEAGYSAVFIEADGVGPFQEYLGAGAPRELVA
jgi:methylmalonyl-CoA mutase cobalamin-binding subunit